jgi:foldase protein PrsA
VKNVRKAVAAELIAVFALSAAGCNMISKTSEGIKKSPVAKFDSQTITKGQLDERMAAVEQQFKTQYGDNFLSNADTKKQYVDYEKQYLDQLIVEKILLKKAQDLKLVPDEKALTDLTNKRIDEFKKNYTEDQVKQAGFSGGYEDQKFKDYAKNSVIMDKVYENMVKDVTVKDEDVQNYYNSNQLQYTEKPNQIHVAHILVKTEDEAKAVKARLDKGEDFAKVAKEVSTDPGSKDNGGDLGTVPYVGSGFDQTFMTAAISLKDGQISAPIQTQFGFHIIKTIKKEEYPIKKFEDVKEEIKAQLLDQAKNSQYTETVKKWKDDAKVKYYENNL